MNITLHGSLVRAAFVGAFVSAWVPLLRYHGNKTWEEKSKGHVHAENVTKNKGTFLTHVCN